MSAPLPLDDEGLKDNLLHHPLYCAVGGVVWPHFCSWIGIIIQMFAHKFIWYTFFWWYRLCLIWYLLLILNIAKNTELDIFFNPGTKLTYHGLSMWDNSPKSPIFCWFLTLFLLEAVDPYFKPCTLPKHVSVELLHREFPVKKLYFPCKGLQCCNINKGIWTTTAKKCETNLYFLWFFQSNGQFVWLLNLDGVNEYGGLSFMFNTWKKAFTISKSLRAKIKNQ